MTLKYGRHIDQAKGASRWCFELSPNDLHMMWTPKHIGNITHCNDLRPVTYLNTQHALITSSSERSLCHFYFSPSRAQLQQRPKSVQ